ncbi:MAG: T9SS type A sorting domain-containing protein, partial [Muribaculaceae bacterium]|nr:T9SS type A sorting domain-containing protein [Muribaculaceae bacterium]
PNSVVIRPKINRDDSTMLADHALKGVDVVDMTEDMLGQLYFATRDEGVYILNNDCSKIIGHFSTDNSSLTTDNIRSILADVLNKTIYVGTVSGLFRIDVEASNSSLNISEIKIYPNPVKPGYNGLVTVDSIVDNTVVKILDTVGNNILSATSTGSKVTLNPSQLSAGIYNVLITTPDGHSKIIGKLMIIR